jgi:3-isopropylmalate/(R)-2-methylmalate dehydratase small subunit
MERITRFTSPTVVFAADDVDTDQVIPARFLKGTARSGWGDHLFADRRYDAEGRPRPEFPLNRPEAKGARVLVAGRNFGCGSSREHAAWALAGRGFRAILAPSFADIFRSNCGKNGLLTVELPEADVRELMEAAPATATVDLERRVVTLPSGREVAFEVDEDVRYRLLNGFDDIGLTMQRVDAIDAYERERERPGPSTLAL